MKLKKQANTDRELDDQILDKADHQKLLKCIGLELPKNEPPVKKQKRSEPSKHVSLFSINQIDKTGSNTKLELQHLLKNVPQSDTTKKLKRKIKQVENSTNQLSAPLPKPVSEGIQRKIEYKKTAEDVGKWDSIVQKNRKAPHLSFPLNHEPFHIKTVDEFFKPKSKFLTPLEKEMHALLSNNKCVERPDHDLTVMEEETLAAMSLEEARARLNELRKHRALLSYHEVKSKRQKKIKSRHYHKMLKKQRMKENSKLPPAEEDPEELDRIRAVERASLRHRKGSKWSKNIRIAAKSNEKLKFSLEEQRRKHVQLLEKQIHSDSENEEPRETEKNPIIDFFSALKPTEPIVMPNFAKNNPWLRQSSFSSTAKSDDENMNIEVAAVGDKTESSKTSIADMKEKEQASLKQWFSSNQSSDEHKYETARSEKAKFTAAVANFSKLDQKELADDEDDEKEDHETQSMDVQTEEGLLEGPMRIEDNDENIMLSSTKAKKTKPAKTDSNIGHFNRGNIDFSHVSVSKPISRLESNDVEGDDEGQKLTIEEAFADDDVVAEFQTDKNEIVNKNNKADDLDLSLPGWGSWGGIGIQKKKKTVRKSHGENRRDSNLGHVILNDKRDVYIAKHQVHALPYPFINKEQFEQSIARPVGNTWNTPEIYAAAIKPRVESSIGTIIPPMNSNELFTEQDGSDNKNMLHSNKFRKKTSLHNRNKN